MESDINLERYEALKALGRSIFSESQGVSTKGEVGKADVGLARKFAQAAITATNPQVRASYFEHLIIAPELGRRVSRSLLGKVDNLNEDEIEFILWLHDIGRLYSPGQFLRNDLVNDRLLLEWGFSQELIESFPPILTMTRIAGMLNVSKEQADALEELNEEQKKILSDYFNLLTPTQRIVFLADNLGKRDKSNQLFDMQGFLRYVRSQEIRYGEMNPKDQEDFASQNRPAGALVSVFIVEKTLDWLGEKGVDFTGILKGLKDYGPKSVIMVRHGQPDNPKDIVYNLDEVMAPGDIIHITDFGKNQMRALAKVIVSRQFRVVKLAFSDQTRTTESAQALNEILKIKNTDKEADLKDVFAPAHYKMGTKMSEFKKMSGSSYDPELVKKYQHESKEHVVERIDNLFSRAVAALHVGETAILVSHGDPIALFMNYKVTGIIPDPKRLRTLIYPTQGEAFVVIIDPAGNIFSHYALKDPDLKTGDMY